MNRRSEHIAGPSVRLGRFSGEELLLLTVFGDMMARKRVNKELEHRAACGWFERHGRRDHGSAGAA